MKNNKIEIRCPDLPNDPSSATAGETIVPRESGITAQSRRSLKRMVSQFFSVFRDDSSSCFVLVYGKKRLAVSFSDFGSFVQLLVGVGLVNQTLSPSHLELLIASRPWVGFDGSLASAVSVRQEIVQRDSQFPPKI